MNIRGWGVVEVIAALAATTAVVWVLEDGLGFEHASALYLLGVAVIAIRQGTTAALLTALGAFVIYNLLFVEPRFTLAVSRPEELITLFLLLFVGIVIGRLGGAQRERERLAAQREREARALFAISRELATAPRLTTRCKRSPSGWRKMLGWTLVGRTSSTDRRRLAPGGDGRDAFQRDRAEAAATWTRPPTAARCVYRIELRARDRARSGQTVVDRPAAPRRDAALAAADQLGAATGSVLRPRDRPTQRRSRPSWTRCRRSADAAARFAAAEASGSRIELPRRTGSRRRTSSDMSRIQGGALVPEIEIIPLTELIGPAVERASTAAHDRPIEVDLPPDLPDVRADAALLDQVVANLLDNAAKYAGDGSVIRVRAQPLPDGLVALTVEDGGPGVPDDALASIFDRFSRIDQPGQGARRGFGLGLAVVRGMVEAMGGHAHAARSELGGLAVTVILPANPVVARP